MSPGRPRGPDWLTFYTSMRSTVLPPAAEMSRDSRTEVPGAENLDKRKRASSGSAQNHPRIDCENSLFFNVLKTAEGGLSSS